MKHICDQVALLGCLKSRGNRWSASWLDRCNWSMNSLSFICGWLTLRCSRRMTLACLESEHGYWLRTRHTFPIWWWTNTFMMRLQNGRFFHATDRAVVFPMIWNMWAQISIGTPVMRSQRNCALPRLMKAVLDNGRLENMINFRVVSSGENCLVPIEVPLLTTSWSIPRTWRMSWALSTLSSYGVVSILVVLWREEP